MRHPVLFLCLGLAACGGDDGATVEGTFAPGSGLAPTGVWVVESVRSEPADSAGFRVGDLTPGPVTLRLLQGRDTAAILNVENLPPGATLRLLGLRVDPHTRLAFPRAVELEGADIVRVNGLRLAPEGRIPREVDVEGAVLGFAPDAGALLVRPRDGGLPDLRVVVGMATEFVGASGPGDAAALRPGDSVRVEGRREQGYVVASRISLPLSTALLETPVEGEVAAVPSQGGGGDGDGGAGGGGGGRDDGGGGGGDGGGGVTRTVARAPVIRAESRGRDESKGRDEAKGRDESTGRDDGRGKGRGQEKRGGRGNGKGKKN